MFGNGLRPQIWQQFVSRYLHKKTALVTRWQGLRSAFIADPDLTDFLDADPDPALKNVLKINLMKRLTNLFS